jgi:SET domain-containing protein
MAYDITTHKYRPLPEFLEIRRSGIQGQGVFTLVPLSPQDVLGLSHSYLYRGSSTTPLLIRTPLGAFINHSSEPNCQIIVSEDDWYLITLRDIEPLEELTIDYEITSTLLDSNDPSNNDRME